MNRVTRAPSPPRLVRTASPLPCAIPGICRYHQERGGFPLVAEGRGGGQPPQQDSSQTAGSRGGTRSGVQHRGCPHSAYTRGGRQQADQEAGQRLAEAIDEASQPEVLVVWQGDPVIASAPRQPAQRACPSTRPFLADSPPLEERSWVPTSTEITWRPRHERLNMFSPTSGRTSSSSAEMTMVSPASLRIPVPERRFPGTLWATSTSHDTTTEDLTTYPMRPTCPRPWTTSTTIRPCPRDNRKPLESILRTSLQTSARAIPTRSAPSSPGSGPSRLPLTWSLPVDSFLQLSASAIANSLRTPDRTTSTDSDSRSSRPRDRFLHTPACTPARSTTSTDSGVLETRSEMTSSASTLTDLLSPLEALRWPLSPPTMGVQMLSPMSPRQVFFPRQEGSSTT